jgi:hypothetical protein
VAILPNIPISASLYPRLTHENELSILLGREEFPLFPALIKSISQL